MKSGYVDFDLSLEPFRNVIKSRNEHYALRERDILQRGSLSEQFNTYLFYGLHRCKDGWILREWAPNATAIYIIGDFNKWQKNETYRLERQDNANWSIKLPLSLLSHGMKYRLLIEWNGGWGARIPSHVRRAVQDENTKEFYAQVWDTEPYKWKSKPLDRIKYPLIYEVHIGMSTERNGVSSFDEFRTEVLPRVAKLGYNAIQIMGIQEHPYYGSFGYQVSNFFAVSSRFGTPEDLKLLIDEAHGMGIGVIMDLVHSHSVSNEIEGLSCFDGSRDLYFYPGERGEHKVWNSRCFDYGKSEVLNFLLSNCKYWLNEFHFDGFRFDGITSMIYWDHGVGRNFTDYEYYYDGNQDENALIYLTLANRLLHQLNKNVITIAEDMSGMPGLAVPITSGGMGFDFRLSMGVPDYWVKLIEKSSDELWHVGDMFYELTNKRVEEKTISYAECHDQAMVGDKTIIFRLIDKEMYTSMNVFERNLTVDRGIALHKMIRLLTLATAGNGYLNFMGNEWGHPEWIDFPREGNNWSYDHARRLWSLVDDSNLRYRFLRKFDEDMIHIIKNADIFRYEPRPFVRDIEKQILIFLRGNLLFVFNFNPWNSYIDYKFKTRTGRYITALDSDNAIYDGFERINEKTEHFTMEEKDGNYLSLYIPSRMAMVLEYKF